jgi:serine/threonine protein kinase
MMQNSASWRPWTSNTSPQSSPPKNPFLTTRMSVMNLQDHSNSWTWGRPSSDQSSDTSSSHGDGALTPVASDFSSDRSRTPTPTAPMTPFKIPAGLLYGLEKPAAAQATQPATNPWASALAAADRSVMSPPLSPHSGASSQSQSPEQISRSPTPTPMPLAPTPLHPFIAEPELTPARWQGIQPLGMFETAPVSPPNDDGKLPVQRLDADFIRQQVQRAGALVSRQSWESRTSVYRWAVGNPKMALILWMADDLRNWDKAAARMLDDKNIPYSPEEFVGVATDPERVASLQWEVALKALSQDGSHVEYQVQNAVPVKELPKRLVTYTKTPSKRLDCVSCPGELNNAVLVRKRLDVTSRPDKTSILNQIKSYHRLDHWNIARITSSYARGQTVAFLTPYHTTLDEYLETFCGPSEAEQLFTWCTHLASALKYMHDRNVCHRAIRPQKILIDPHTQRIYFAVFGITHPGRAGGGLMAPFSTDPAYVYAAPEQITERQRGPPADVFALGCIFLDMVTAAKGMEPSVLAAYRSEESHDASFHANLERVNVWVEKLKSMKTRSGGSERKERVASSLKRVLTSVEAMLKAEPSKRPPMKKVLEYLEKNEAVRQRRRSMDVVPDYDYAAPRAAGGGSGSSGIGYEALQGPMAMSMHAGGIWGDLETLNSFYRR